MPAAYNSPRKLRRPNCRLGSRRPSPKQAVQVAVPARRRVRRCSVANAVQCVAGAAQYARAFIRSGSSGMYARTGKKRVRAEPQRWVNSAAVWTRTAQAGDSGNRNAALDTVTAGHCMGGGGNGRRWCEMVGYCPHETHACNVCEQP